MPEEYLQIAFEIKASCDEISRRLLRWHWEQKPGAHSVMALIRHLEQRKAENPDYYDRLPALETKTSWQQWDTTLCMRVLLDPEKDAAHPLDLLGNTPRPAAARRACNAVRTARNEAAHAGDRGGAIEAALRFNEAVECLEDGYLGTAFGEKELAAYYRTAEEYIARCKGEKRAAASSGPEVTVYPTGAARERASAARAAASKITPARSGSAPSKRETSSAAPRSASGRAGGSAGRNGTASKTESRTAKAPAQTSRKKTGAASGGTSARRAGTRTASKRTSRRRRKEQTDAVTKLFWALALLTLAAGLLLRARSMGYLPF